MVKDMRGIDSTVIGVAEVMGRCPPRGQNLKCYDQVTRKGVEGTLRRPPSYAAFGRARSEQQKASAV